MSCSQTLHVFHVEIYTFIICLVNTEQQNGKKKQAHLFFTWRITSNHPGRGGPSVWSMHVLPVAAWVPSGFSGFLPQTKNMQQVN